MRRNLVLPTAALIGVASIVPLSVAALSAPRSDPDPGPADEFTSGVVDDRYGVVGYDAVARRWAILSTSPYESRGLTGVSCSPSTGKLTVSFAPLRTIGTFTVDEDDAYAGRYAAGAAPTTQSLAITFRRPATGAVVSCDAAELRIASSSLQVWVRGTLNVSTSPPSSPTRPMPPSPVTPPPPVTEPPPPPPPVTEPPSPPATVTGTATVEPSGPVGPPTATPGTR